MDCWIAGDRHYCVWVLAGLWLESYIHSAIIEAGADESLFNQKIEWMVDDVRGINEIDVLARKGNQLIMVSCKAVKPPPDDGRATELREYLFEAHYWNLHFANQTGKAALVTTADLIAEHPKGDVERFPPLTKQAEILDVVLIGVEDLEWDRLVERLRVSLCA
jgi:hypothetical protein